jgi:hypothetical protein
MSSFLLSRRCGYRTGVLDRRRDVPGPNDILAWHTSHDVVTTSTTFDINLQMSVETARSRVRPESHLIQQTVG